MSKFNTFLAAIGMVFLSLAVNAQVNFNLVPSDAAPDLGATITVDVAVDENFQDIGGFQFTIDWDETLFSYQGLSNFGLAGLSGGNFGTTQTGNGILTVSWPDPFGGTQSIDMDSVIFTLTFDVITTEASTTNIDFTSSPLTKEVLNGVPEDITGSVVFNNSPNIVIGGGGNPGTTLCNFMGFGLAVTSDSADTGDPVCVDVIACNFSEIVSFQYTTQFDPNKLQFDSITNFNLDNLSAGNFGTTNIGNGFITSSWLDTLGAGVTVADETVIYSVCFTAVGAGGDIDTVAINGALSQIEVTDANSMGADIGLESLDGEVTITGNSSSAVSIKASCEQGNPGDTVTVDISVANFDSISGMQMSLLWDPTIIDFLDREWTGQLPGSPTFNTSAALVDAGKLSLLWDDPNGATSSVMDDSIIFKVRYIIVGDVTDVSTVSFTDDPTVIEINQEVNGTLQSVPLAKIQGKVEVVGEGVLGFVIEDAVGCTNDTICIPVTVDNFNEITSMQYDFEWDDTELTYIRTQNHNSTLEGLTTGSFNQYNANHVRLSWTQGLLEPRTLLEGNDTLFQICFRVNGADGTTADLIFDETQTIEVSGGPTADLINVFTLDNGVVTVSCAMDVPMTVSDTTITNVLCNGDNTGAINLTLSDATGAVSFLWGDGEVTQNISNLTAGTYSVTITDDNTTLNETYTVSEPSSALSVSMSSTDVSVNGGSDGTATATPSGGTMPYSYLWSNGGTTATITGLTFGNYTVTVTDANNCTITDQVAVNQPGSVTAVIGSSNVTCNGFSNGSATVTPGGGVPGYTFLWSTGATTATITGLAPGTYSVTVTDSNTATAVESVTITQPTILMAVATGSNATCNGFSNGSATASPSGGTPGYTFLWSTGATTATASNLAAGSYTVTVTDANTCTTTASVSISEPAAVTASISSSTNVTCNGESTGSATVTAGGGTPGYTYLWSNSATTTTANNLAAGTYTVTVTDANSCTSTASITITQPSAVTASISTSTNVTCNGESTGSATVTAGGGSPGYTFLWSTGATTATANSLAAGTYTVTVTDASSCTGTTSVTITQPTVVSAIITSSTNVACNGESTGSATVLASGGTPGYTYLWSTGATTATASNLAAGTYTVTVMDVNNCSQTTSITITEPTVISATITSTTDVACNGAADGSATVSASGGTPGYTYLWSTGGTTATINNLAAGIYDVTVTDANNCTQTTSATISEMSSLVATISASNNVTCNGDTNGSATVSPSGGTAGYTILWSTGATTSTISNLAAGSYTVTVTDANNCDAFATATITEPTVVTGTITASSNITCNGFANGSATVTPGGGTAGYTYLWSNGATTATINNLAAGSYTVTVSDANSCTGTTSVTITEPADLTAAITATTNVACSGQMNGSATVTAGGGTTGYTYLWSNGGTTATINNLDAGSYTVTVTDANNCTETATATIAEESTLSATISSSTDVACNGAADGSATVMANGGVPGYSYLWSNGGTTATINNLSPGTYSVTITDTNGCDASTSVTISELSSVTASIASSTNVTCNGFANGSATVAAGGGTPGYTYLWSNGGTTATITSLDAGTYTVTVSDINNCTETATVTITEPAALSIGLSTNSVSCNGFANGSVTATPGGGTAGYTFVWSNGATGNSISSLSPGTYTVTLTDGNNCTTTETATITQPDVLAVTGVVTNESAANAEDGAIDITPAGGTEPWTYVWSTGATTQDISSLTPGSYSVTITDANGCTVNESFTVNSFEAPQITVENVVDILCNGDANGAIDISVAGGVSPYTYLWTTGATTQDISGLTAGNYSVTVTDNLGSIAVQTITVAQSAPITVLLDGQVNVACNGDNTGSISITVSGGTPNYSFNWGGGITAEDPAGLSAGTYTPTITDANGCTTVGTPVTITEPTPISISVTNVMDVACNGESTGAIDVDVTGGTPGYTYLWSNGSSNQDPSALPAGNYTLTVTDAANCILIGPSITVTEPPALTANSSSTDVTCDGASDGTINLTVNGGTPTYSYNWSGGLANQPNHINVAAGSYSVTITDISGCSIVEGPIQVSEPTAIILSNTVLSASATNDDGGIDLTVTGGTPNYTYDWNTGATTEDLSGLSSGCYAVTVTDANGCMAMDSVKVGGVIVISAEVENTSCAGLCDGSIDITINGGIAPYTYSWTGPDVVNNAQDQNSLCAGTYSVTVQDANSTQSVQTFTIESPTALTVANSNIINESGNGCNGSIDITITGGTLPYTYQWSNGDTSEDVDDLCKGDYSVTIVDANGCVLISNQFTVLPPPLVVSMSNMTMASCSGEDDGEACLSVLGGCGPYTVTLGSSTQVSVLGEDICFADLAAGTYVINVVDSGNPQMTTSQEFTITTPDPIAITSNIINNTDPTGSDCDGSIDITVVGGTIPYNYQWSNGAASEDIINLCSGGPTYSVTVTDANGCVQILNGLEVELGLNVQVIATADVSCMGDCDGSIDISVTGGVGPYTYSWSNAGSTQDLNNLCTGSYDVTVTDANGMMANFFGITIAEPSAPLAVDMGTMVRPTGDNADGSISLDISGGWGGYTIEWSNGATGNPIGGLVEGFYTATITDANGCVEVITIDLQAFRLLVIEEMIEPTCNGDEDGQIEVVIQGGSGGFTITWDNGQTGPLAFSLATGTYCVTVSDNSIAGLEVTECYDLGQPDELVAAPIVVNSTGPADGSIDANVSGGTAPYTYLWTTGDVTPITDGLVAGVYGLVVTDANGCELIIQQIEVGVEGECFEGRKVITPNGDGRNDEFIISCVEGINNNLKVFNRWGQLVYEADNYDNSWSGTEANGDVLPESGYFWVLEYDENGQTKQIKGAFTLLRGDN